MPLLQDGRVLEVTNVIWCTGFDPGFSWINLPVFDGDEPKHDRGIVPGEPGLYFVGLHFLYAMSSTMIHGVGATRSTSRSHAYARQAGPVPVA
jgi:putative flavoprotein involved in K+ transport